jgi:hypothetical protein
MKSVMNEINTYMKNNGMTENVQLKYLCNDIAIVYQTLGTRDAFMYSCSRQASNGDERMHNVVVTNNSRFAYDSDSDSDDGTVQRACFSPSKPKQRACAPSSIHSDDDDDDEVVQRSCAPSNYDNDIDNFCITDETPFTSENVGTILKSFNDDKN